MIILNIERGQLKCQETRKERETAKKGKSKMASQRKLLVTHSGSHLQKGHTKLLHS
jgi:hypothetical protein